MATTKITNPELFDLGSLNTALQLPSGTTAQRPTSPSTGEWRYNTDNNLIEYYDGGAWRELQDEEIPPVPSQHFNTVLYDGTSATQSITGVGFQPDFVWIKRRDGVENHYWQDSSRGSTQQIYSNLTNAQFNETTAVTSFDSDGFTMGSYNGINNSGESYVAWCWKLNGGTTSSNTDGSITSTVQVNSKAGISIVQYTGTQANATVGHGLGVAPSLVITKALGAANGWPTLVQADSTTRYDGLRLNEAGLNNSGNGAGFFQNKTPTDSVFYLGNSDESNRNATATIAYCFAEVAGFSSIGGYSGNGSDNGPIINTGFEPAWLMIKVVSGTADGWFMVDNKRDTSNPRATRVFANSNVGDAIEPGAQVDFFSNGFQLRGSGGGQGQTNKSGSTYIYIAFASDPSAAPVLADSFNTNLYTGNGTSQAVTGLGFSPSLVWIKQRDAVRGQNWYDVIRGKNNILFSNSSGAQDTTSDQVLQAFNIDGFSLGNLSAVNASGGEYVSWNWKATTLPSINTEGTIQSLVSANQAAGFSIVAYTGDGNTSSTVGHGLPSAPKLLINKSRGNAQGWAIVHEDLSTGYYIGFSTSGESNSLGNDGSITKGDVNATNFGFTSGASGVNGPNLNGNAYITYCFIDIPGYSKIGSYTGTGAAGNTVTVGFEPSWIMIKRSDSTGGWLVFDNKRNTSNPRNTRLEANNSSAEQAGSATKFVDFDATSFEPQISDSEINASGGTYIYLALKENPSTPAAIPAGEVAYLVVGAGGGGGGVGGGAGAGGLRTSYGNYTGGGRSAESNITLSAQTYTITIGAGGTASATGGAFNYDGNTGSNGTSSVFGTITSLGGGGGTGGSNTALSGGSGGGCRTGIAGEASYGQGFDGATGNIGGGGGGAGGAGLSSTANNCGSAGGPGLNVPIIGATTYYSGGGAGGSNLASGCSRNPGGIGGGGDSGANNGTANTGGGGGGGVWTNNTNIPDQKGGNGASGVVILRMNTSDYSGTTTGSPTVTTVGSETILTYTGSGTYVHS